MCVCLCISVVMDDDDDAPKTIYSVRERERRIKCRSFISWNIIFNIYRRWDNIDDKQIANANQNEYTPFCRHTATLKSSQHLLFSCRWANILAMMQLRQQQQQRQVQCPSEHRYFVRNAFANSVVNLLNCLCTWKFSLCFCLTEPFVICNAKIFSSDFT